MKISYTSEKVKVCARARLYLKTFSLSLCESCHARCDGDDGGDLLHTAPLTPKNNQPLTFFPLHNTYMYTHKQTSLLDMYPPSFNS